MQNDGIDRYMIINLMILINKKSTEFAKNTLVT